MKTFVNMKYRLFGKKTHCQAGISFLKSNLAGVFFIFAIYELSAAQKSLLAETSAKLLNLGHDLILFTHKFTFVFC